MTIPEAARRAGRDPETVRRWVRSGRLPARKIGTQHIVREEDLEAVISRKELLKPAWLRQTSTGEKMPDVLRFLSRQRLSH
jgi:excisionase family DNA binding protein